MYILKILVLTIIGWILICTAAVNVAALILVAIVFRGHFGFDYYGWRDVNLWDLSDILRLGCIAVPSYVGIGYAQRRGIVKLLLAYAAVVAFSFIFGLLAYTMPHFNIPLINDGMDYYSSNRDPVFTAGILIGSLSFGCLVLRQFRTIR